MMSRHRINPRTIIQLQTLLHKEEPTTSQMDRNEQAQPNHQSTNEE